MSQKSEQKESYAEAWNKGVNNAKSLLSGREDMRKVIAERIRNLRMERKLTQEEVGDCIKAANWLTYKGYENCKSDIPIVYLVRLADLYQVSMDYLTGRTEEKQEVLEKSMQERLANLEQIVKTLAEKGNS